MTGAIITGILCFGAGGVTVGALVWWLLLKPLSDLAGCFRW